MSSYINDVASRVAATVKDPSPSHSCHSFSLQKLPRTDADPED